jgi:hypothetical protein
MEQYTEKPNTDPPLEKAASNFVSGSWTYVLTWCRVDLNAANDLWQRPRFPALQSFYTDPVIPCTKLNMDTVLEELRSFDVELAVVNRSLTPFNRPHIQISDRILFMERRILDLIHNPLVSQNALDHSCAIAALVYMRSNVRDGVCNFGIIETVKLQIALQSLMDLADMRRYGMEIRSREKLVWTAGFGAVSSSGKAERPWFVRLFKDVCDVFELRRWECVKAIFETVLWKDELNDEGIRLWEEMQMI